MFFFNYLTHNLFFLFLVILLLGQSFAKVDNRIPVYETLTGIEKRKIIGILNSEGSDTLGNLLLLWMESFKKMYSIKEEIQSKGSSSAPTALIEGISHLGPMSRQMKQKEIYKFESVYGYKPTAIPVAIDGLAVYVHKDNPIKQISFKQLDGIFSSTYKLSGKSINLWGELVNNSLFKNKSISTYGRNSASGTYSFFKKKVLDKGDYKNSVKEQSGSAGVIQSIGNDLYSIGYSGVGFKTSLTRFVPVVNPITGEVYEPNEDNIKNNNYPISRNLYIYINKQPGKRLEPKLEEFLKFILSRKGQETVEKEGFFALSYELNRKTYQKILHEDKSKATSKEKKKEESKSFFKKIKDWLFK